MSLYYPKANSEKPSRVTIEDDRHEFTVNAYWPRDGIWEAIAATDTREQAEQTRDAWLAHRDGRFDYTTNTIIGA